MSIHYNYPLLPSATKNATEKVCSSCLLHIVASILTYVSIEVNNVDPNQTAAVGAN